MIADLLFHGWTWGLAYLVLLLIAASAFAVIADPEEVEPAECPWEGGELETNPRQKVGQS